MSTWGSQLIELRRLKAAADATPPNPGDDSPHDQLRRKYLKELSAHTGRATIYYGTCWLENIAVPNVESLSLNLGDKQGFMEAVSNVKERVGPDLDEPRRQPRSRRGHHGVSPV